VEDTGVHAATIRSAAVAALALKRTLYRAARNARDPRRFVDARHIRNDFVARLLDGDRAALRRYERELRASGLLEHLLEAGREHQRRLGGEANGYSLGAIGYAEGTYLYSVVRTLRPQAAVETGVANGFSTAFLLQALEANGDGHLHSIDLPREVGRLYEPGTFYEGRGRAGIPSGAAPGWLVPHPLRTRWTLVRGRSQEELPGLLDRLGTIDFFMHDSEHSFDCMWFELNAAWPRLSEGGVLVCDDVNANEAFTRFAEQESRRPLRLARGMALLTK
jgi:predicted O-methyltransferase YrrM